MNTRHLFLVGYDIQDNSTRRRALRDVQHHALGGQKSFYECWLTVAELQTLELQEFPCSTRRGSSPFCLLRHFGSAGVPIHG
jgi:hypothetical protein